MSRSGGFRFGLEFAGDGAEVEEEDGLVSPGGDAFDHGRVLEARELLAAERFPLVGIEVDDGVNGVDRRARDARGGFEYEGAAGLGQGFVLEAQPCPQIEIRDGLIPDVQVVGVVRGLADDMIDFFYVADFERAKMGVE